MVVWSFRTICLYLCILFVGTPCIVAADIPSGAVLRDITATAAGGEVRIGLQAHGDYAAPVTQVLIDADDDAATGLQLAGYGRAGFDLLVEGEQVHRFAGEARDQWQWESIGQAGREAVNQTLTLTIGRALLPGTRAKLVARTLSADYQQVISRVPANDLLRVTLPAVTLGTEQAGDADDAARDVTNVVLKQDGGDVVVTVTMCEASNFANVLVFLAEPGAEGGYRPVGADQRFGLLINGQSLHGHQGDDPAAWNWSPLGEVQRSVDGRAMTLRFDGGVVSGERLLAGVWSMSEDWLVPVDRAPDLGLYELQLDRSLIKSSARAPVEMAAPKANRHLPARQRVAEAKSFYVYYGSGEVAALSHFDLIVAHSPQMAPQDIARLTDLGVVMIGYITVGEDDQLRRGDGSGPGGYASWYFDEDQNDQPDQNSIWKSYFANANDPAWRADRVAEARRLVEEEGYDGIFLDTIDTAHLHPRTEGGMVQLVRDLREALPDAPIILNQGFTMFDRLAPLGDAIMIESFTATYDFDRAVYHLQPPNNLDWNAGRIGTLVEPVLAQHPMPVLSLEYAAEGDTTARQAAFDRCATFGFLCATAPIFLDRIYLTDLDFVANPDPKWRQRQATPQALSVVLDQPANGFPKATRILPSGSFGGYEVATIVDGVRDRSELPWSQAAWASAEDGQDAWIEFRFPQPIEGGELVITWAVDGGKLHVSQNYRIEIRQDGGEWNTLAHRQGESAPTSRCPLPDAPLSALRIIQPAGGGSEARPDLMWIAQVERRLE